MQHSVLSNQSLVLPLWSELTLGKRVHGCSTEVCIILGRPIEDRLLPAEQIPTLTHPICRSWTKRELWSCGCICLHTLMFWHFSTGVYSAKYIIGILQSTYLINKKTKKIDDFTSSFRLHLFTSFTLDL